LIGDTDRYLAKQNPRKISGSLISPVRCAFIKKKEEKKKRTEEKRKEKPLAEIERAAMMPRNDRVEIAQMHCI